MLDELITDLREYPAVHVELSIVNFGEPGANINPGENCTFRVVVHNKGPLDMLNVQLHLNGLRRNGTTVTKLSQTDILGIPVNYSSNTLTTAPFNLAAGESWTSRTFYMVANRTTNGVENLIEAHIAEWDAGLQSILRKSAGHSFEAGDVHTQSVINLRN